jgi:hypothetical protein
MSVKNLTPKRPTTQMDTITPAEIQAVETIAIGLSARAHLLDLACGGLCSESLEAKAQLIYADVEPVHTLAKEVTTLAETLAAEATNLRLKITPARVRLGA